jgi:pimeloyl-ACP methyl ester carboxylesterase
LALDNPGRVASLPPVEPACFNLLRQLGPAAAAARAEIEMVARMVRTAAAAGVPEVGIAHFVDYWNGRGTWAQLSAVRRDGLLARAPQVIRDFEAIFAERMPLAGLRKVQIPALIVLGSDSPAPARLAGRAVAGVLPCGSMITVRGAGHMLPTTHPEALMAILAARLGSAPPAWRAAA